MSFGELSLAEPSLIDLQMIFAKTFAFLQAS